MPRPDCSPAPTEADASRRRYRELEVAYQVGVGSALIDDAVRCGAEHLFLLAADAQLTSSGVRFFPVDSTERLLDELERTLVRLAGVSTRLEVLGKQLLPELS